MHRTLSKLALAGATCLILAISPVSAEMMDMKVDLKGTEEVPPNDSGATGTSDIKVDTEKRSR